MKKLVYMALLVAFGFVVGCKNDEQKANDAAKDAAKTATNAPAK